MSPLPVKKTNKQTNKQTLALVITMQKIYFNHNNVSILKFNACNVQAGLLTWNKVGTGNFNDHYQLMGTP